MPRRPRSIQPGTVYHLISRFVAREWFIEDSDDRRQYLQLFGRALINSDWSCFAYAIMSNHIHLAMIAGLAPLASWIGNAHGPFAEWINQRHDRIGSVFVRGPKAIGVRPDGVARLVGYIHRNPVRAGIAAQASDSDWTSHRGYLQPAAAAPWLDVARGLDLMRFEAAGAMDTWVNETRVGRSDLDAIRIEPLNRGGRPRKNPEVIKLAGAAAEECEWTFVREQFAPTGLLVERSDDGSSSPELRTERPQGTASMPSEKSKPA